MTTRTDIVEAAKTWIDVPYKDKGRDRYGVDCIGIIIKTAHEVGLTDYDTLNYSRRPNPHEFLRGMKDNLVLVPKAQARNGSVLIFREPRHPCHTGLLEVDERGQRWVIHSYAPAKKVIREALGSERWLNCVMAFDFPGLED